MARGKPGLIVLTKNGKRGRTFNSQDLVNGKVVVYLEHGQDFQWGDKGTLCDPDSLTVVGMID